MEIAYKIRQDLICHLNFIRLTMALMPPDKGGGIFNPTVIQSINATEDFINVSNEKQLIEGGPVVLNALDPILKSLIKNFPPKKDLREISHSFQELLGQDQSLFSFGIPFDWLDYHIDISKFLSADIPYQAKIGTGHHAGKFSLEEMYLLDDGFFLLALAETDLKLLLSLIPEMNRTQKDGYADPDFYNKAHYIKLNVCSYARNSITNLYSFIECFVNSIGFDFYLRYKNILEHKDQEILQGLKGNGYLSLEYKLEKFHQIIRADHKQRFCVIDSKQRQEPFLTFFEECKEIRDAAMHYSPNKKSIWLRPTDWTDKAKHYSEISIKVAQVFWKACYPDKAFPFYLRGLEYSECYDGAFRRLIESTTTRENNSR
jgi:hypothetical protein